MRQKLPVNNLKEQLEKITHSQKSPLRLISRTRIVLLALSGKNHSQIARRLKCSLPTVRKWIKRWNNNPCLKALDDASRSGHPLTIPALVKCEIMKTACSPPK